MIKHGIEMAEMGVDPEGRSSIWGRQVDVDARSDVVGCDRWFEVFVRRNSTNYGDHMVSIIFRPIHEPKRRWPSPTMGLCRPTLTIKLPIMAKYGLNSPSIVSWLTVLYAYFRLGPSEHSLVLHCKYWLWRPFWRPFWVGLRLVCPW